MPATEADPNQTVDAARTLLFMLKSLFFLKSAYSQNSSIPLMTLRIVKALKRTDYSRDFDSVYSPIQIKFLCLDQGRPSERLRGMLYLWGGNRKTRKATGLGHKET